MKKAVSLFLTIILILSLGIQTFAESYEDGLDDVFVTEQMVARDRAEVQKMAEDGQAKINMYRLRRSPTQKQLSVPHLYQDDGAWANKDFPCGHDTYGNAGCAATSYAMVARRYGYSKETPVTFAEKYQEKNRVCICNQTADGAARVMGRGTPTTGGSIHEPEEIYNICVSAIDSGRPVVIRTNAFYGSHYVVAYGYYITTSGNITIYIRDPEGDYDASSLGQYFNNNYYVRSYAIFR
ncbi:C39 family peptidase [Anaerotruncus massiliensis (ex Liu et al. 2021)]|mgnify:CR=1 FL=1|uniref:C39 family peptidase n=1 Tax=Anaerotruncus massiliensis (ex Liu et al. 2021) TaxID=2321404 RepID=UPI003AB4C5E8